MDITTLKHGDTVEYDSLMDSGAGSWRKATFVGMSIGYVDRAVLETPNGALVARYKNEIRIPQDRRLAAIANDIIEPLFVDHTRGKYDYTSSWARTSQTHENLKARIVVALAEAEAR